VPDDLVEAAKIDGATDRQAFFKVVLPYIKGTIITVATTTVIAVLKIFDIIQTMGKGGSFGTSTIANEMYETGLPAGQRRPRRRLGRAAVPAGHPDRVRQLPQPAGHERGALTWHSPPRPPQAIWPHRPRPSTPPHWAPSWRRARPAPSAACSCG
jgi:hypothetical protein